MFQMIRISPINILPEFTLNHQADDFYPNLRACSFKKELSREY